MVVFFAIDGTIIDGKTPGHPPLPPLAPWHGWRKRGICIGRPYSHTGPRVRAMAFQSCGGMEEVKAVAGYVTAPVMEDGIEKALAHFGLL